MGKNITVKDILSFLQIRANAANVAGMERFGINSQNKLGIGMTDLRAYARTLGKNHSLAMNLWQSGIYEARMLAAFIEDPKQVTEKQLDSWVLDFDSWALCDTVCGSLFEKTVYADKKISEWMKRDEEYVKRAGIVMIAWQAVHDKKASNQKFLDYLDELKKLATDERNFVKKAVNWSLRQIGKRNAFLNDAVIKEARKILKINSRSARWIASNALQELQSKKFPIN